MWDAENFATGEVPASECMTWVQLGPMERWALRRFGWLLLIGLRLLGILVVVYDQVWYIQYTVVRMMILII